MTRVEPRPRADRPATSASRPTSRPFAAALREACRPQAAARARRSAVGARDAEARAAEARAAPPDDRAAASTLRPAEAASLRAVVRTLPVAVAALAPQLSEGVALDLGRALSVELRPTPAGLEVVLRPAPEVARVASAELPALARALRERGVRVATVQVRPRGRS